MSLIRPRVAFSLALALAACAKVEEHPTDSTSIVVSTESTSVSSTTSPNPVTSQQPQIQPPGGVATPERAWTVTERGIGNLRAGMTVAEARSVVPAFTVPASRDSTACTYAKPDGLPSGVSVMVQGGKVVRVEVRRGQVATSTAARIGDSEERIRTLYPNQVSVSPSKYAAGGNYLTVVPASTADAAYRIIFETDGRRVVNYRAGLRPQVEYVEGCG